MADADRDSGTTATGPVGPGPVVKPDLTANKQLPVGSAGPGGLCGHRWCLVDLTATLVEEAGSAIRSSRPPLEETPPHAASKSGESSCPVSAS